jgi:hypothetical protein
MPERASKDERNPYERFGIDPLGGPAAITERMRELVEDAPDDAARAEIRAAWEELTLHPLRRLRAALGAHPEHRAALGLRPRPPDPASTTAPELGMLDLAPRPSVLAALGASAPRLPDVPPERDPFFT